jgi:hypothetical protein
MFSLRGDAHKIFLKLEKALDKDQSIQHIKEFKEIEKVKRLYQSIDSSTLRLIYYRMVKEKNGSGIIPIFVSSIPWLMFMFSNQLSTFLFNNGSRLWVVFCFVYIIALTISVVLHFREKAWAAFHIEIIQDILNERKMKTPLA